MSLKVTGVDKFSNNLLKLRNKMGPRTYTTIILRALVLIEANSARRTPVDTGNLKLSGLGKARVAVSVPAGTVGYTTNTADYAIYVHERLGLNHPVGEAKFLEKAVNEIAPKIEKMFGVAIKTRMFTKDMV